jgi:hypothetical protein
VFPDVETYEKLRSFFETKSNNMWQQDLFTDAGQNEFHLLMPATRGHSFWSSTKHPEAHRVMFYFNGDYGFIDHTDISDTGISAMCVISTVNKE